MLHHAPFGPVNLKPMEVNHLKKVYMYIYQFRLLKNIAASFSRGMKAPKLKLNYI